LLNYQTLVSELTGLPVANASLLDEASAAAETVNLSFSYFSGKKDTFFLSDNVFPQAKALIRTRAYFLNIKVVEGNPETFDFAANKDKICGVLVQSPDNQGIVHDYQPLFSKIGDSALKVVATDLLALMHIKTPGE
jgi:glycine dehydrogenase